jgi:hypothetical protein
MLGYISLATSSALTKGYKKIILFPWNISWIISFTLIKLKAGIKSGGTMFPV